MYTNLKQALLKRDHIKKKILRFNFVYTFWAESPNANRGKVQLRRVTELGLNSSTEEKLSARNV